MMWSINFVFVLLCLKNVIALKKTYCQPLDNECLTNAVREHAYQKFVVGLPGVPPSDPLHLNKIDVQLPNLDYTLRHPTLLGMKSCDFLNLKLTKADDSVSYHLFCPHLMVLAEYEVSGEMDGLAISGRGKTEITYKKYDLTITGKFERVMGDDGKQHFHIIEYCLQLDLQGGVTQEYQNLSIADKGHAGNRHSKKLEELTRDIVMKTFFDRYVRNLKDFQKVVPLDELHFRYV